MNVKLEIIPVTVWLPVRILMGHTPVYVTKDTLEMGNSPVQVIVFSYSCIYMTIWSYNLVLYSIYVVMRYVVMQCVMCETKLNFSPHV